MIPIIALVGRPNVGKSTLFNCLTKSQAALVSNWSGLTRDRQYGEGNIADHTFIVIDTAGLTDDTTDIDRLTVQQSMLAITEADYIFFVVDGRAGLTVNDSRIAEKIRSLNKTNVVVVVNKSEDLDANVVCADFYQLGFNGPCPIAAAHALGIKELIIKTLHDTPYPVVPLPASNESLKLALVGRPNVGKSTLTNRLLGDERVIVYDEPGTTRDSLYIPLERQGKHYTLIDTAGIRRRGKVFEAIEKFSIVKTLQAIKAANVVLFMMDASEGVTEQDLRLLGFIIHSGKALVMALNKWDSLSQDQKNKANTSMDRQLTFLPFIRLHSISALHGTGIGNLFTSIDEAYESATRKLSTPQLTKLLTAAILQHAPPLAQGRRIKLRYAHSGGSNPPTIVIHGNQVHALPESYKRYLASYYQKKLKLMGTPIRIELKLSTNPFKDQKNTLTDSQKRKKRKLISYNRKKDKR